jgi:uncharacterized protein YkwD
MSQPDATTRHRHRHGRKPSQPTKAKRPLLAIAAVMLVITPITWILFHEPDRDQSADDTIRYATLDDDRYPEASDEPVSVTASPVPPSRSASPAPRKPTPIPSGSPTPGRSTPTAVPTVSPTDDPTGGPTTADPSVVPTTPRSSLAPTPSEQDPGTPTDATTAPQSPVPSPDNGSMSESEQELFSLINTARTNNGCAPLRLNSGLTADARADAERRAESGKFSGGGSSAVAGGDNWDARTAFNQMMDRRSGPILNCDRHELGVGRGNYDRCTSIRVFGRCLSGTVERVGWVADFD